MAAINASPLRDAPGTAVAGRFLARSDRHGAIDKTDLPARILAVICLLNINGVMWMVFDQEALVSFAMLGSALFLVIFVGRRAWSLPFSLLMGALATYLALGVMFSGASATVDDPAHYVRAYGGTLVVLWGAVGYAASLVDDDRRALSFLLFVRGALLVAAASVWFSPILYRYYANLPRAFSFEERMGGFFANPNEAAMVSVFAVVFVQELPFRNRLIQWLGLLVSSVAVFLTFSKTGMTCVIVYLAWSLMRKAKGFGLILLPLVAVVAILLVQDPDGILRGIAESPALQLGAAQQSRVLAIGDILGGQIDEETTTGRTYLWQLAAARAWETFPLGNGLGSGHHMVGGLLEAGVWQGAHNTFLMMWSESGVLPVLLLIAAMMAALSNTLRHPRWHLLLPTLIVLLVDMMATHTALSTRYHNMVMALAMGLAVRARQSAGGVETGLLGTRYP
ncbi:MAG: O-antigen ligase family protein [Proteobacteria bacterium]|nr:O-antigen ligase family protein [Pseudomonadota bacterium]